MTSLVLIPRSGATQEWSRQHPTAWLSFHICYQIETVHGTNNDALLQMIEGMLLTALAQNVLTCVNKEDEDTMCILSAGRVHEERIKYVWLKLTHCHRIPSPISNECELWSFSFPLSSALNWTFVLTIVTHARLLLSQFQSTELPHCRRKNCCNNWRWRQNRRWRHYVEGIHCSKARLPSSWSVHG